MSVLIPVPEVPFLATRQSLVEKLKDLANQEVWREFFDLYWKLIYGVAIKAGYSHEEAEDLVQETVLAAAKNIGRFRADPAYGSFKGWLLTILHRKMKDLRRRAVVRGRAWPAGMAENAGARDENTPLPNDELEALWEREWRSAVVGAALEKLKRQVQPRSFQAFFLHVVKEMPASETAEIVGMRVPGVYLVKHRVGRMFREYVREAEKEMKGE